MKEQPTFIVLDKRETLAESIVRDVWTFGLLLLCIWASHGSKWWTFATAIMFMIFTLGKITYLVNTRQHKFKSAAELEAWAARERSNTN